MKNATKLIALLLVLCTALPLIVGCGNTQTTDPSDTDNNDTSIDGSVDTSDPAGVLNVPEKVNYDGHEFVFLVGTNVSTCPNIFSADEESDDPIDQAIYKRNLIAQNNYNITITEVYKHLDERTGKGAAYNEIFMAISSDDILYDAAVASTYDCGTLAQSGYIADLRTYNENLDITKNWWDQAANKQLTIFGCTYFTAGDISYIDDNFTYAITFNKDLAKTLDKTDLYELVESGKWTYDELYAYSKAIAVQDTVVGFSDGDTYGFLGYTDTIWMTFSGIGGTVAAIGESGGLELTLNTERNFTLIQDWTDFRTSEAYVCWQKDAAAKAKGWGAIFSENYALFFGATIDGHYKLRNTDLDYGFLPFPKYDETQENYNSGMSPNHSSLFCIPNQGNDAERERTAILVQSLGYHSDEVISGFYEKNLQGKFFRDEESYMTLDIIFANKVFDLGYYYNIGSYRAVMWTLFGNKDNTFSSRYAQNEPAALELIAKINDLYRGLEN